MSEPTKKSEEMEQFLDSILPNPLGRQGPIKSNLCSWCGEPAAEFKDTLSRKEYAISGFCQSCQDETFGK